MAYHIIVLIYAGVQEQGFLMNNLMRGRLFLSK